MQQTDRYHSPLGMLLLTAEDGALTKLAFASTLRAAADSPTICSHGTLPPLVAAKHWLDLYFSGEVPDFQVPMRPKGTAFQTAVWQILMTIPYGETKTYGEIAAQIAAQRGIQKMSAQAVGGAVGRNPIAILIPCHRVLGANHALTGYSNGLDRKIALLTLEEIPFQL